MKDRQRWQTAYIKQARSDWRAYRNACQMKWQECHRLLLLQMATEKLGKALLLASHTKFERVTRSHSAFVKFMQVARYNRNLQMRLGLGKSQIKVHFSQLLPIAYEIETLAPALSQDGPNPEYPWIDGNGQINTPCEFKFPLTKLLQSPQGIKLLKHIKNCIEDFEKIFPS